MNKNPARKYIICFFTVSQLLICTALAQHHELDKKIQHKEESLKEIRTQIEECRREQVLLQGKEATILDSIRIGERERTLLHKLIGKLDLRQDELEREIDRIKADLSITKKNLETHRHRLAQRLRSRYKRGRSYILEVLFTAQSSVDLFRRYTYLTAAAKADRNILLEVEEERARLETIQKELAERLVENKRLNDEKKGEEGRLGYLQEKRRRHIAVIQNQISISKQTLKQLEEEADALEKIIERLEDERLRLTAREKRRERVLIYENFAQNRGRLPWPTHGQIISSFGLQQHPIFKTKTINKGIDIQAPLGTNIFAVAPGDVILTDWLRGYGKFVILDHHGGYYTLYAHTSEIVVVEGDRIDAGELIAKVGTTGSFQGPMLHFEIRKGKKELDPLLWLRKE